MANDSSADIEPGPDASPLGQALGLSDGDVDAMGDIFTEAVGKGGLDGAGIFARLKSGSSIREALRLPPGTIDLLYSRAHQWFQIGRADRAEPLFRALCVLDATSPDYWVGYGVCLRDRGVMADANVAFLTAAKLRPDWAIPHFHLFDLYARSANWAAAEAHRLQFDKLADGRIPQAIRDEARRLKAAVELHRSTRRSG